jgi:hypothetical protein
VCQTTCTPSAVGSSRYGSHSMPRVCFPARSGHRRGTVACGTQ